MSDAQITYRRQKGQELGEDMLFGSVEAVLVGKHGERNEVIQDVITKMEVDDNKDTEVEHEDDI
jgi:hypothetical protein